MVNMQAVAVATKAARQAERRRIGRLRNTIIQPGTEKRYVESIERFLKWLADRGYEVPSTREEFDEVVSEFIEILWDEGAPKGHASDLVSGLQHKSPPLKGHFALSWRLLKAWGRAELPCRAPPMPWVLLKAAVALSFALRWDDIGVLLWVSFDAILRTGEMLQLSKGDIFASDNGDRAVINLGWTKGGIRRGVEESVVIEDPAVARVLNAFVQNLAPGDFILKRTAADFRAKFDQLMGALGAGQWKFKPYSIRRGGATRHFREGGSLSATTVRGRWGNSKTARIYINEGLAACAEMSEELEGHGNTKYYAASWELFLKKGRRPKVLTHPP